MTTNRNRFNRELTQIPLSGASWEKEPATVQNISIDRSKSNHGHHHSLINNPLKPPFELFLSSLLFSHRIMGASSSTDNKESSEKREIESLAASTGALPLLQRSFSKLADPQTNTVSFQSFKVITVRVLIVLKENMDLQSQ